MKTLERNRAYRNGRKKSGKGETEKSGEQKFSALMGEGALGGSLRASLRTWSGGEGPGGRCHKEGEETEEGKAGDNSDVH